MMIFMEVMLPRKREPRVIVSLGLRLRGGIRL
jgi:hypothetical protein